MNRSSASVADRPGWSGSPSNRAVVTDTSSGSVIGARSTYFAPSRKFSSDLARDFDGKSGLARTAGAGQGDEPVLGEDAREIANLRRAADEARQLKRKPL